MLKKTKVWVGKVRKIGLVYFIEKRLMLGPITQELIDQVITEVRKEENQQKLKNGVIDPLISYLHSRVYTYLQFLGALMGIMILLLILILYLVWRKR